MLLPNAERPVFLIIAGPNGSGKTSVYLDSDVEAAGRSVWIINPDLLAARIRAVECKDLLAANIAAVERIEVWLEASINAHQTVGVETVLSTAKYRRLVTHAKRLGFETQLIYVILDSPRRNVERVRLRVERGGHDVPEAKIIERYARSLGQLPWFLAAADRAWLFDNSATEPRLIGEKRGGQISMARDAMAAIVAAAEDAARQ